LNSLRREPEKRKRDAGESAGWEYGMGSRYEPILFYSS